MATLEVHRLSRSYPDEVIALRDASFTVEDGRIAAILGPSGCGKTTMLRLIAGLDRPDRGDIRLAGASILDHPPHRRGVGLMFQDLALFPHMNVRDNVAFGLRMHGWSRTNRLRRIADLLDAVGLRDKADRKVHELSGGEQQRVALARTLAPQPSVLLLDEPLGSLDEAMKVQLRSELRQVLKALETTAIIVSHDLRDAVMMADDLIVMDRGRVLQSGSMDQVLSTPSSPETASMVGYALLVRGPVRDGRVVERGAGGIELPPALNAEGIVVVMAHPASMLGVPVESNLGCGVVGQVARVRSLGPLHVLDLAIGYRTVEVRWEWDPVPPPVGATLAIAVQPGTLRFFGTAGGRNAGSHDGQDPDFIEQLEGRPTAPPSARR